MKKYFIKGTDKELKIGDIMELNFIRVDNDDEEEFFSMQAEVDNTLIRLFVNEGTLEEFTDNDPIEFVDDDMIDGLIEANEELEKRADALEEELKKVKKALNTLIKSNKTDKFESNSIKK
jgi:hypothetical protein